MVGLYANQSDAVRAQLRAADAKEEASTVIVWGHPVGPWVGPRRWCCY
mgnify:CR=1 FL=1